MGTLNVIRPQGNAVKLSSKALCLSTLSILISVLPVWAEELPAWLEKEVKTHHLTRQEALLIHKQSGLNGQVREGAATVASAVVEAGSPLGKRLLAEARQCVRELIPNPEGIAATTLKATVAKCVSKVAIFDSQGRKRPEAEQEERVIALLRALGEGLPTREGRGEAIASLSHPQEDGQESKVFTVPVRVGAETKTFLLDTGAAHSVINNTLARKMKLSGVPLPAETFKQSVVGNQCTGKEQVSIVKLPELTVGLASVRKLTGTAIPANLVPGGFAGAIGLDFLSAYDMVIDPKLAQLQLLSNTSTGHSIDTIALHGISGLMVAQVRINGKGPFALALDTGADEMVISQKLMQRLGIKPKAKRTIVGWCGQDQSFVVQLNDVTMGNHTLKNLKGIAIRGGLFENVKIDGLVGQNFLNQFRQHWHFESPNELGLVRNGSIELEAIELETPSSQSTP
ncbi:MAG: clan AA aspartic protease [Anaerolineae bacterium]|nr:clan AA aspartic protease [Gloeobacterales cyanobacterium ES-bin-313]